MRARRALRARLPLRSGASAERARAEFVNLLSSEAAEHCEKSVKKSTINPEHVLSAMEARGAAAAARHARKPSSRR